MKMSVSEAINNLYGLIIILALAVLILTMALIYHVQNKKAHGCAFKAQDAPLNTRSDAGTSPFRVRQQKPNLTRIYLI